MPNNIVAVANKAIRPVKDNDINGSKLSTVSSMILPFNSARRKQISDALNTGRLNTELANALVKENGNAILNGLMNADLLNMKCMLLMKKILMTILLFGIQ